MALEGPCFLVCHLEFAIYSFGHIHLEFVIYSSIACEKFWLIYLLVWGGLKK